MSIDIKFKNKPKILGLDISTKTIGFALFDMTGSKLLELTHFSPKIKPQPEEKIEELIKKAEAFKKHLEGYKNMGIVQIVIEEPLLQSNNIYTIGTLLRYNTLILKACYDVLEVLPTFISTYNSRKYAFPDLVGANDKGRNVLFGGPLTQQEFINKIKTDDEFAKTWGELGPIYGKQWRQWEYQYGDEYSGGHHLPTFAPTPQL